MPFEIIIAMQKGKIRWKIY